MGVHHPVIMNKPEESNFDEVPFEPASHGRLKVRTHDGGVYLVTWKEAIRVEPEHAENLGFELIRESAKADY